MKLSEAILKGCEGTHQIHGSLVDFLPGGATADGACALGAAMVALNERGLIQLLNRYTWAHRESACPACGAVWDKVYGTIAHLNDHHRWTREAIAMWVESLERGHEQADVEAAEEGVGGEQGDVPDAQAPVEGNAEARA